ncbi:MAG: DNA translocase FtsK 4TM domain-containing protein [Bacteroidia bacterium]|nr:DNA translocase FtsK [Bacteroidia bacterium]MDW8014387.1 DNA translocase FtsK 4TM domain-containing protein [Bacteroidia bacterium]
MSALELASRRHLILSIGVGIVGVYLLTAVLAYFASYTTDLPALEGAPSAVPLNNPTGWIGAKIAHRLIYRGFGWAGVLFPIGLLYAALSWVRRRPIRLRILGWGLAWLYLFSTFGGWLVRIGWVEDLIWCGSVGAGLTAWMSLYIGDVGLLIIWLLITSIALLRLTALQGFLRLRKVPEIPVSSEGIPSSDAPNPTSLWYEVVHQSSSPPSDEKVSPASPSLIIEVEEKKRAPSELLSLAIVQGEIKPEPNPFSPQEQRHEATTSQPNSGVCSLNLPPLSLLAQGERFSAPPISPGELEAHKDQIVRTLQQYGIQLSRITATVGPTVTLFEVVPAPGVRISRIKSLEDDIALNLAALGIRIIAPIPGKGTIGIEVPNARPRTVPLIELLESPEYQQTTAQLPLALGKTITGEAFIRDLTLMPHLLIAGATGQGKSVALNCMILSLLYKCTPEQVRFILIDPKKVEMSLYQGLEEHYLAEIPGLSERIITDVKQALPALQSLVQEMEMRYELLKELRVRTILEYNRRCKESEEHRPLPYLVLIIDELADLMMTAGKEVETPICRLAQLARAVGIHLIVATQRPSVNVITGLIKANFPVRISFRVVSRVDSRVILDDDGAERLVGRGDMLFAMGTEMTRLQSGFVSATEIESVVAHIQRQPIPSPYVLPEPPLQEEKESSGEELSDRDPLFYEAALLVVRSQYGSTSLLQRKLGVGFNRAGRLMDQLERAGIVGPARGSKPREVLIQDEAQLHAFIEKSHS